MNLSAALSPVLGNYEVALRNEICRVLGSSFDSADWLTNPPQPFQWRGEERDSIRRGTSHAQKALYAKKSQAEKRALDSLAFPTGVPKGTPHELRSKARQNAIQVDMGQLTAQLTLFFWKRLFSADYETTLWKRALRRLFPEKSLTRAAVAAHLETLYQARNRVAQHEPILGSGTRLTLQEVLVSVDFIANEFGNPTASGQTIIARMTLGARQHLQTEANALQAFVAQFAVPIHLEGDGL